MRDVRLPQQNYCLMFGCTAQLKCDGTRVETRSPLSAKRTSPFKSAGASIQSATGSRGVRISGSNAGYTMFRGSVKSTGYPLNSPVSPSLPLPCVTVCHHISAGLHNSYWPETLVTTFTNQSLNTFTFLLPQLRLERRGKGFGCIIAD